MVKSMSHLTMNHLGEEVTAEQMVRHLAIMLGWSNTPPWHVLERDLALRLKPRGNAEPKTTSIPQVTLPVPFDQIPTEVKRLRDHANGLRIETNLISQMLSAVYDCCPHPQDQQESWQERDGSSGGRCKHCGKTW